MWPSTIPNEVYYPLPGWEQNLTKLLAALKNPPGQLAVVISGLGGLGKTAMAGELARRAVGQNAFEGVIGESAKMEALIDGEIVPVRDATLDFNLLLDSIAGQLGFWEIRTLKPDEKRERLVQLLRRHRYLVFIDNLETAENTKRLVESLRGLLGSSQAIITSRHQVRHDFVESFSLQELEQEDALFFLQTDIERRGGQQLRNASPEKLIEIYKVTAGAPLAMKLVVAQAAFLDLNVVLRQLRNAGTNLYTFIFLQSWAYLPPAARKVLMYIARTVVTTVDWEELASVGIAANEQQLLEAIDHLVAFSLLNVSDLQGQLRYGIHQLTRQFVTSELPRIWKEQGLL